MTTTLVSDADDHREKAPMVLGRFQCQLPVDEGISNVVVAHHPPEWLRDQDTVLDHLRHRSVLQLFGHKHSQRVYKTEGSIVVSAGAVHPERHELGWSPCYNIIRLLVTGEGPQRELQISVEQRTWKDGVTQFGLGETYERSLELPEWTADPARLQPAETRDDDIPEKTNRLAAVPPDQNSYRRLIWGFHSPEMGFATKMSILSSLHLVSDEDQGASTLEIFERAFSRAADRGQLGPLWHRVNSVLGGTLGENPFIQEES